MHHQRASLNRGMRTVHGNSKPHVALGASAAWTRPTTHVRRGHQRMPKVAEAEAVVSTSTQDSAPRGKVSKSGILDASTSFQVHEQQDGFVWTRNWWPIAPLDILDTERPTAHTILGQDLVVWWSKEDKAWHAFKDMCPHRLAPLSQGRIVDGSLVCSYHGWSFGPTGACNKIPQIEPAEQGKVCSNKRTCASYFPTMTENNCLYVWLDTSEQGLAESRARGVAKHPCPGQWSMLQVPNDFRSWMEQAMDPSHANFLHAGEAGFVPENAIPMTASAMPFVHPTQGFTYAHGGYEKKNATMVATRDFIPPSNVIGLYRQPTGTFVLATMFVPVKPGVTRTFASFGFLPPNADHTIIRDTKNPQATAPPAPAPPKPAADSADTKKAPPAKQAGFNFDFNLTSWIMTWVFRLVLGSKLPHWVTFSNALNDQDCIIMHGQERNLMTTGMDDTNYVMPAVGADVGVAAINRWLRMVKYPTSLFGDAPMLPRMTEEQLLERQSRHAAYCIQCKKGLQLMNKLCWATTLASAASAVLTIGLVSAALVTQGNLAAAGWPALAACGASTLLGSVAGAMWDLREERFISGLKAWRKKGGLSFVKQ